MEKGLTKTPGQHLGRSTTSNQLPDNLPDKLIVEAVDQFNKLRPYPLTTQEIIQWAATLERVLPGIDALALCWLVDEMLAGRYEYDRNAGIQQLINGYKRVQRIGNSFKLKIDFPG